MGLNSICKSNVVKAFLSSTSLDNLLSNASASLEARGNDMRSTLSSGVLWSVAARITNLGFSFAMIPLSVRYFGNERYGLWMLTLSTLSLTSFFDLGITPTIKNKLAQAFAEKDEAAFKYYSSCAIFISGLIIVFGIILSFVAYFIDWSTILNIPATIPSAEVTTLVVVLLAVLMSSLGSGMIETIYASRLEMKRVKVNQLISLIIGFIFFLISISLGGTLPFVAVTMPLTILLGRFVLLVELGKKKLFQQVLFPPRIGSLIGSLLPSSLLFLGIQMSAAAFSAAPNFLIAQWSNLGDVATFSVAYKLVTIPLFLTAEALPVFWPAFTIAWTRRDTKWLRKHLWTALAITSFALVVCSVLFVQVGGYVIALWTSNRIQVSQNFMFMLCLWLVVQGIIYWLSTFLHSINDFFFEFVAYIATTSLLILFSYLTVSKMGLSGIAFSMFAALVVGSMVPMILRVRSKVG
jgi:O-antigen/teichoic acid export membrane protein